MKVNSFFIMVLQTEFRIFCAIQQFACRYLKNSNSSRSVFGHCDRSRLPPEVLLRSQVLPQDSPPSTPPTHPPPPQLPLVSNLVFVLSKMWKRSPTLGSWIFQARRVQTYSLRQSGHRCRSLHSVAHFNQANLQLKF